MARRIFLQLGTFCWRQVGEITAIFAECLNDHRTGRNTRSVYRRGAGWHRHTFGCRRRDDRDRVLVFTVRLHNGGTRESGLVPVEETTADVVICPVPAASPRVHFLTDVVVVTVVRVRQPDLTLRVVATVAVGFWNELFVTRSFSWLRVTPTISVRMIIAIQNNIRQEGTRNIEHKLVVTKEVLYIG